jgi:flagellar motor switch protein FliG
MNNIFNILQNLIQKKFSKTNIFPFCHVFKKTSPQILYNLINSERNQTIAFILSFSKNKNFIDRFLDILVGNEREATKNYIIEYLNNCFANSDYAEEYGRDIERVLEKKIEALPTWIRRKWKLRPSD